MIMDPMDMFPAALQETSNPPAKRKRSPSLDAPTHTAKVAKTHSNHLQINYLARQSPDVLPLITAEDPLPSLLSLIAEYDGVLHRHESMAGNLGARPLGPILIKRFERLFDGPPRVLKSHGKEGTSVGWLDVVEFARNKPEQFNLEKMRDGVRVCQFYTKQSRVEITEEDYVLIASGMPQKLIPPQPISEDEEKELGTLEILEKNLGQIVQRADQVSARARQLNHRLKNRKNAIISRREAEAPSAEDFSARSPKTSSARVADMGQSSFHTNGDQRSSVSPSSGFVAVNSRPGFNDSASLHDYAHDPSRTANVTIVNGTSLQGASAATRAELLSKFFTTSERAASVDQDQSRRASIPASRPSNSKSKGSKQAAEPVDYVSLLLNSASPVPIPNTPSALLPYVKPTTLDRFDDSGPYKAEMVTRMEQLQRGDRIQPPCDRCRRLHMDCLKNLTACMGCTKKHAKCSWKDVNDEELRENPYVPRASGDEGGGSDAPSDREGYQNLPTLSGDRSRKRYSRDERRGVADEELLGEDASGEEEDEDEDLDPRDDQESGQVTTGGRTVPTTAPLKTDSDPDATVSQKDLKNDSPLVAASQENETSFQSVNGNLSVKADSNVGGKDSGSGTERKDNSAHLGSEEHEDDTSGVEDAVYAPSTSPADVASGKGGEAVKN